MSRNTLAPSGEPLPAVAPEVLESLYQHRLLSARQVRPMHAPQASLRWTQTVLAALARRGLARFVRSGRGAPRLYFISERGADAVELIPTRVETRRKLITPEQAAGPLRAHTLAVNDAGIAFLQAARARGDECGPFAWRHELAHPIGRPAGRRRQELLICDALLSYLIEADGELAFHYRFLELDRATLPVDELAAKLARYARLYRYTREETGTGKAQPAWRERYPVFPGVLCILAGKPRRALERRRATTLALLAEDPELRRTPAVEIAVCLLSDLLERGPFAAIFSRPSDPDEPVDWHGQAQATSRPTRAGS